MPTQTIQTNPDAAIEMQTQTEHSTYKGRARLGGGNLLANLTKDPQIPQTEVFGQEKPRDVKLTEKQAKRMDGIPDVFPYDRSSGSGDPPDDPPDDQPPPPPAVRVAQAGGDPALVPPRIRAEMFDVATPRAQGVPPESTLGLAAQLEQQRQAEMEQTKRTVAQLREQGLPSERGITDTVKFAMRSVMSGAKRKMEEKMEEKRARDREREVLDMAVQQQDVENENLAAEARAIQAEIEVRSRAQPHLSIPHQAAVRAQAIAQASRPLLNPGGVYAGVLGSGAASSSGPAPPPRQSQGRVPIDVPQGDDQTAGPVPPKAIQKTPPPARASGSAPTPPTVEYSPTTGKARAVPVLSAPGSSEAKRRGALAQMVRTERTLQRQLDRDDVAFASAIAKAQAQSGQPQATPPTVPPLPGATTRPDLSTGGRRQRSKGPPKP